MEGLKFPNLPKLEGHFVMLYKPSKDIHMGERYRGMQINFKTVSVLYIHSS
jgi:hypothetical protein